MFISAALSSNPINVPLNLEKAFYAATENMARESDSLWDFLSELMTFNSASSVIDAWGT